MLSLPSRCHIPVILSIACCILLFIYYYYSSSNHLIEVQVPNQELNLNRKKNQSHSLNDIHSLYNFATNQTDDEYYVLLSSFRNKPVMVPHNNAIVYSLKMNRNVLYHCNVDDGGLGNNVFSYWWTRSFAFYLNLEYQFVINTDEYIDALSNTSDFIKQVLKSTMHGTNQYDDEWIKSMKFMKSKESINGHYVMESVSKFIFLLPIHSEFTFSKYVMQQIKMIPLESDRLLTEYERIRMYFVSVLLSPMESTQSSQSQMEINEDLMDKINAFRELKGQQIFVPMHYPWDTEWKLFYLNDIFRTSVMAPETSKVFENYKKTLHVDTVEEFGRRDIVIHIRCGDIMSNGKYYSGFQTFDFYRQSLDEMMQRNDENDDDDDNDSDGKNVYVLLQLIGSKAVGEDVLNPHAVKFDDDLNCKLFAEGIIPKMEELIFDPMGYTLHWVSEGTLHEDYYRLMKAPNVICGTSTFCMAATMSNVNATTIVWPTRPIKPGPLPKVRQYAMGNIVEIENIWIRSTLITNRAMNGSQVATYVITH